MPDRLPFGSEVFKVLFDIIKMQSFSEYVNRKSLIEFIIKERVKCASKGTLSETKHKKQQDRESELEHDDEELKEIQLYTPPRNKWLRVRQKSRKGISSAAVLNKLALRKTIRHDIRQYENTGVDNTQYLQNLLGFTDRIIAIVNSDEPIDFFGNIKVIAQHKKNDEDFAIYRPLCVYDSLEEKALITLASSYLTKNLDGYLHEYILSYRSKRQFKGLLYKDADEHDIPYSLTDGSDAIKEIKLFVQQHPGQQIFVAECDIQKFYDVINHDVVLECFKEISLQAGIPQYHQVERILKAYLDSYSFHKNIISLNDSKEFWNPYIRRQPKDQKKQCKFEWVNDEALKLCYPDEDTLEKCKSNLGVPQGGALSCVISNVVLNSVDVSSVVRDEDPNRFFARYGDDILLAHTDFDKCQQLMDAYLAALRKHHLPYHEFKSLDDCKLGSKTTKEFWDRKSKAPFRWGPGEGNAFEWIGFVGYEVNHMGNSRLRKSTLEKKFGSINKMYHSCFLKEEPRNFHTYMQSNRRKIAKVTRSMEKFSALDVNRYSIQQMQSLDRYRLHKIKRLQSKLERKFGEAYDNDYVDLNYIYLPFDRSRAPKNGRKYSFFHKLKEINK